MNIGPGTHFCLERSCLTPTLLGPSILYLKIKNLMKCFKVQYVFRWQHAATNWKFHIWFRRKNSGSPEKPCLKKKSGSLRCYIRLLPCCVYIWETIMSFIFILESHPKASYVCANILIVLRVRNLEYFLYQGLFYLSTLVFSIVAA